MSETGIHDYTSNVTLVRLAGFIVLIVALYLAVVAILYSLDIASFREARIMVGLGAGAATVGLAAGIIIQGFLSAQRFNADRKQRIIDQESKWIPEVHHPLSGNWLLFQERRPWYPWFKISVGQYEAGWEPERVWNFSEDELVSGSPSSWHEKQALSWEDPDAEWYIPIPDPILSGLKEELQPDDYAGKLYFRFETLTAEDYFFVYEIEFSVDREDVTIFNTPHVERYLPWQDSEERDRLRRELEDEFHRARNLETNS